MKQAPAHPALRSSRTGRAHFGPFEVDVYVVELVSGAEPIALFGADSVHRALGLGRHDATLDELAAAFCARLGRRREHVTPVFVLPPPSEGWEHPTQAYDADAFADFLVLARLALAESVLEHGTEQTVGANAARMLRAFVRRGLRDAAPLLEASELGGVAR